MAVKRLSEPVTWPARRGSTNSRGIGPHEHGDALAVAVAGRQVEGAGQLHAVGALVGDELLGDAGELRRRVLERSEGTHGVRVEVADQVVRRLGPGLAPGEHEAAVVRQRGQGDLVGVAGAPEPPLGLERRQVEPVEERTITVGRRAGAGQVDAAIGLADDPAPGPRDADGVAGGGVAVLGAPVPQGAAPAVGVEQRGPRPPRAAVVLGQQRGAVRGPRDAAEAELGAGDLGRLAVERRSVRDDAIAVRDRGAGVAPVLGLDPDEGGGPGGVPREAARPGGDAADGDGVGEGQPGDRRHDLAAAVPHRHVLREAAGADQPRERPLDLDRQQMLAARRGADLLIEAGPADRGAPPGGELDGADLAGEVVLEQRLVVGVLQKVLEGPDGRGAALVLLDVRSRRRRGRGGGRPAGRGLEPAEDGGSLVEPVAGVAPRGVDRRVAEGAGLPRRGVHDPRLDAVVSGEGEQQVRAVRRVLEVAEAGLARRVEHVLRAVLDPHHGDAVHAAAGVRAVGPRVQPRSRRAAAWGARPRRSTASPAARAGPRCRGSG